MCVCARVDSQVLCGVKQQEGADRRDVPGQTAQTFLCLILGPLLTAHANWVICQLLLKKKRKQTNME